MKTFFTGLLVLLSIALFSQDSSPKTLDIGLEAQQYPTGYLLGIRAERGWANKHSLSIRLGYNGFDHQNFGVHDGEAGGGFGGTLGYRYYFRAGHTGLFLGLRTDVWRNKIDWKDYVGDFRGNFIKGQSRIVVLQPTAIAGYLFLLKDHWIINPTLAFGAEINVKTEGEPVGEGAIFLWGLNLSYRL